MTTTDYILNGILIGLVVLQIRGRRLTFHSMLLPIGTVSIAAVSYLHSFPTAGNDLSLVALAATIGATLGVLCASTTRLTLREDGHPFAKAGPIAAALWLAGVGTRMAFELYATHGGAASIERFSASHDITTLTAWTTALVLMAMGEVLGRTVVLAWRAHGLRTAAVDTIPTSVRAGSGIVEVHEHATH